MNVFNVLQRGEWKIGLKFPAHWLVVRYLSSVFSTENIYFCNYEVFTSKNYELIYELKQTKREEEINEHDMLTITIVIDSKTYFGLKTLLQIDFSIGV